MTYHVSIYVDALISSAIDELEAFQSYLRVWNVGRDVHGHWKHVHVDALMVPVEQYHEGIFFQVSLFLRGIGELYICVFVSST